MRCKNILEKKNKTKFLALFQTFSGHFGSLNPISQIDVGLEDIK